MSTEPIAWKLKDGLFFLKRYLTEKQYEVQSSTIKACYEPYYCANCREHKCQS